MRYLCLLFTLIVFLSACGQKAALYLPVEDEKDKNAARKNEEGAVEK